MKREDAKALLKQYLKITEDDEPVNKEAIERERKELLRKLRGTMV